MKGVFVTGTDTEIGKTVTSAWLVRHLRADYWKPVQSGTGDGTDVATVTGLTEGVRIHPSVYELPEPLSPHEAARRAGVQIEMERFALPASDRPVVVEGAGGVMVPLNGEALMIDLMARLALPVVLVTRTTLGTINHTLLSLEALRRRSLRVLGLVLSGPDMPHNRAALESYGQVPVLAWLPPLDPLTGAALDAIPPERPIDA